MIARNITIRIVVVMNYEVFTVAFRFRQTNEIRKMVHLEIFPRNGCRERVIAIKPGLKL